MFVFVNFIIILNDIIAINNKTDAILNRGNSEGSNTRLQKLCVMATGAEDSF